MKRLRIFLTIIVSVLFLLLLTACSKDINSQAETEAIGIVDSEKAFKAHKLYSAWQMAVESELSTQRLKESHIEMTRKQALAIDKLQELQQAGRQSFFQADFAVRMSEAHLVEREKLKEIERTERLRISKYMETRFAAIEEEYKLPLFNLKTRIESLKPAPRMREQAEQERKEMIAELTALQAEKHQKLNALHQESDELLAQAMKSHEEQAVARLQALSSTIYNETAASNSAKLLQQRQLLADIPEAYDKTIASLEKQLLEQKAAKDKLYARIYEDISSHAIKIAKQKNLATVLTNIKYNIKAQDITDEVIASFTRK